MNENQIEEIFLKFIKDKLEKKQQIFLREINKRNSEIKKLQEAKKLFIDFEKKHHEELCNIYKLSPYICDMFHSYLSSPLHEIDDIIRCTNLEAGNKFLSNFLPEEESWMFYSSDGYIWLSYLTFEKELGVSKETAKKYLKILKDKNLIESKRCVHGIEYKII